MVSVDEMQFGFMPERGTIDAVFILRRLQEEYYAKGKKLCMYFVDSENAFDRISRKVLVWTMRKKGMPYVLVRSVMSLYEGAKTRVRVDSELSGEFEVKVGMHQVSVLSHFFSSGGRCCLRICLKKSHVNMYIYIASMIKQSYSRIVHVTINCKSLGNIENER